jgi:deoxyribodipyrimidine photo-lyase
MSAIHPRRIQALQATARNPHGRYVLYWMQQSQRASFNHALEFAVQTANNQSQPLLVVFGLTETYPEANWRHYAFLLEGLQDVSQLLTARGVAFRVSMGNPVETALEAANRASVLICDRGYLRHQRRWRQQVAHAAPCPVIQVESDVLVPVLTVTSKTEYAARTIRPKIQRLLPDYLRTLRPFKLRLTDMSLAGPVDFEALERRLEIDRNVPPVSSFLSGGHTSAREQLKTFITHGLSNYNRDRNRPSLDGASMMSPYLHFGHISPLEIVLAVQKADAPPDAKTAFLEELIVRRELAVNYAYYCRTYDSIAGLPQWCRQTLSEHRRDHRNLIYSPEDLEAAATDDPYWNAAMLEMKQTGYMHPYMRMYWGKKILQWRPNPEDAFNLTLKLNNKYFLDGRDPNSYAGVGWIYGLHDQAWKERPIFGKVRYMARRGLERKFDMPGYIARVHRRIAQMELASAPKPQDS